ncbi:bacillithiol biosynthesis deacetylase BshB2 [Paenibacillus agaridevorans]|uniref:bacillithiol biosynthesis deacetylase BshB2 n=1 Tax=Paenibacillus agaridevorans TaxID=171404 RepID=UPI000D58EE9D|nr:bacillithiol biosynthesis deacetylase BshB2 [Paenibacillus agaridevorans]
MAERILVLLPHPDDEAYGMSGTLALYVREGAQVTYGCLTLGEMGRNMGVPPFASRVTLPAIRKLELEEACRAIGIQDLRLPGFHDKTIEFEEPELLESVIAGLLDEVRPTLVFTFYPGYSVHPDHDATGAAVVRVIGRIPAEDRPKLLCVAFSKDHVVALGAPDVQYDVRETLPQKVASISAHRSQFPSPAKMSKADLVERFGTERFYTYKFHD